MSKNIIVRFLSVPSIAGEVGKPFRREIDKIADLNGEYAGEVTAAATLTGVDIPVTDLISKYAGKTIRITQTGGSSHDVQIGD